MGAARLAMVALLLCSPPAAAQIYYVDATDGDDSATGDSPANAWQTLAEVNGRSFTSGTEILLQRGESWDETLDVTWAGVRVGPYGSGDKPLVFGIDISADDVTIDSVDVDHQRQSGRAVRIRSGHRAVLRGMEIANGTQNGVDGDDANGLLVDGCHIHHFLAGSFDAQADAHGIVVTDTVGVTVRDTEIHHVSGDSFQADPDRNTTISTGITFEGCHLWTSPLTEDFNAGWVTGDRPGENAIDTKVVTSGWDAVERMTITVRDTVAHGWLPDSFIANKAAFNMKEKITAVFDGVTVYDNEIAFRLRGTRGNADVTLINAVVYDNETAIRSEDDLANLEILNCTFGHGNGAVIDHAGGSGGVGTWDVRNNAFVGTRPSEAAAVSNLVAVASDFIDSGNRDYDLPGDSNLVGAGETIAAVSTDRLGRPRVSPYDVGAYELGLPADGGAVADGGSGSDGTGRADGGVVAGDSGGTTAGSDDTCKGDCDGGLAGVGGGCGCGAAATTGWFVVLLGARLVRRRGRC